MITYWKSDKTGFLKLEDWEENCWINVEKPTENDLGYLRGRFNLPVDLVNDIFDINERARTEYEDGWHIIILRIPVHQPENDIPFVTVPLGIFMSDNLLITITNYKSEVISDFIRYSQQKHISPTDYYDFFLGLFMSITVWYLKYLKQINTQTSLIEKDLERSVKNKDLHRLLKMEKCLVYFTPSLKGNEILFNKIKNSSLAKKSNFDPDFQEDIEIELRQAIEMAHIYSNIQSGMMEAFSSIISNNLNFVMKQLTSISILLMFPTLIASFYGMNVPNFLEHSNWSFAGIVSISALISFLGLYIFKKNELL